MKAHPHLLLALGITLVCLQAPAQVSEVYSFTNLSRLVPDGNWSGLSDAHSITSSIARLDSVRVKLQVTGEFNGDLYCYLRHTSPTATNFCVLLNRLGRSATSALGYPDAGLDIEFDDLAASGNIHTYQAVSNPPPATPLYGTWQPDGRRIDPAAVLDTTPVETTLASFNGADTGGTWTLFIADVDRGATNMLAGWGLELSGALAPAITWGSPAEVVYGTILDTNQLNASAGLVPGTFSYQPPADTILNAGTHTLHAIFTPADSATYLSMTTSVSINVLKKGLAITAQGPVKAYDGLAFSGGNVNYEGFVNGESAAVLGGTITFSGPSQGAINAGSYVITPSGLTSDNYAITFVDGLLTVTPAPLTVTAHDATKVYDALPFTGGNGVSYAGFVNGETDNVLGGALTFTGTSQDAVNAGAYVITPGGLTSQNYAINFADGTLTISKAGTEAMVSASPNPVKPGDPVLITATLVAVAPGAGTPTGSVQFLTNGATAGPPAALSGGLATFTTSDLTLGNHTIAVEYAGDENFFGTTNSLTPVLLVNTPPLAQPDIVTRYGTNTVKVAIATLLSNDSDSDGDALTFVGVTTVSTNNGVVTQGANWINYAPPPGSTNADSFTYTISDGRGAPVAGTVLVQVVTGPLPSPTLTIVDQGNGSYVLEFNGIPGLRYRLEYSESLTEPNWLPLGSATADETGRFRYIDTPPQGSPLRYYRSVFP